MGTISVVGDRVSFEVEGWDKFWALKSQLQIPLSHIHRRVFNREGRLSGEDAARSSTARAPTGGDRSAALARLVRP